MTITATERQWLDRVREEALQAAAIERLLFARMQAAYAKAATPPQNLYNHQVWPSTPGYTDWPLGYRR